MVSANEPNLPIRDFARGFTSRRGSAREQHQLEQPSVTESLPASRKRGAKALAMPVTMRGSLLQAGLRPVPATLWPWCC
jgi:hypothetical protein